MGDERKAVKRAPKCKAIGCSRKTKNDHGYCFAHADMRFFVRAGYNTKDAKRLAKEAIADAAMEDGYDGP